MKNNSDIVTLILYGRRNETGKSFDKQFLGNDIAVYADIAFINYSFHCIAYRIHFNALPFIC